MNAKIQMKAWIAREKGVPAAIDVSIQRETAKAYYVVGHAWVDAAVCCCQCGRDLTHPVSRLVGIGPECGKHYHVPAVALGSESLTTQHLESLRAMIRSVKVECWVPKSGIKKIEFQETPVLTDIELIDETPTEPETVIRVVTEGNNFLVSCQFNDNAKVKAAGSARWDKNRKCWALPKSGTAALALAAFIPAEEMDEESKALAAGHGQRMSEAKAVKGSKELAEHRSLTSSWMHQRQAFQFLLNLGCGMLAMEMGTGKTKVAIDLMVEWQAKRTLIVCPKAVCSVWPKEIEKHAADQPHVVTLNGTNGAAKAACLAQALLVDGPMVAIVNYESVWRDGLSGALLGVDWDLVILDESHRIKTPSSSVSKFCAQLAKAARRRLCLTGTPMPNSPLDVFGQYRFVDPTVFGGSFVRFRERYAVMGGYLNKQVLAFQRQDEMSEKMYSVGFRVTSRDVLDLPETLHVTRTTQLSAPARRVYQSLQKTLTAEINDGTVTAANALTQLLRLQQVTSGVVGTDDGGVEVVDRSKQELLEQVLDEIPVNEPVVVFARFRHDLNSIKESALAQGRTFAELSGEKNELAMWQAGKADVLAVQIRTGGAGIDLTRSKYAIYYSLGFSLGDYEQSLARTHRPWQTRNVTYIHLVVERSVDEKVYDALRNKTNIVQYLVDELRQ